MLQFNKYVTYTPSEELRQIARIESMDFVDTVNIMNDTNFDQFWAHYFTLHKRQFFEAFAYGGRVIGTLPDSYQLRRNAGPTGWGTDIFVVQQGPCLESYPITSRLTLCKARGRLDATVTPGDGWWALEPDWSGRIPGWRWSGRNGRIADVVIENRSVGGQVSIKATYGEAVPVTVTATELRSAPVVLKVGRNVARFTVELDPILPANDARRTIGIMWKQVLILPSDLLGE